jgi:hypothetical protein
MFKLIAKAGAVDFLFPYVNVVPGEGECMVPGAQSDGCIATTGGMNGCSLQVDRVGNVLMFYHDNSGISIAGLAAGSYERQLGTNRPRRARRNA